jgi:hypothetical protein
MERDIRITRVFGPEDQGRYLRLPFDVPPDTDRVEVAYAYERFVTEERPEGHARREAAIVDLGVYDESGRLRGWSGSERASVSISASAATPGYTAGPVRPGRWAVALGLYRIRGRVDVAVTIRLPVKEEVVLAGDLHVHTVNSDGRLRTPEIAELARRGALDFVAFTDHNSTRQNDEITGLDGVTAIPGMEYTNYRGHANLYFPAGHHRCDIDPFSSSFEEMRDTLAAARAAGAVVSLNHPFNAQCPWAFGFEGFAWDMVEAWNGTADPGDARTIAWWHGLLSRGMRTPVVGGSDFHRHEPLRALGTPTTFVRSASRSASDIVAALVAGRSFIAFSRAGPHLDLRVEGRGLGERVVLSAAGEGVATVSAADAGDHVRLLDGRGGVKEWDVPWDGDHATRFAADPGALFYRLEVRRRIIPGVELLVALSNPVYVQLSWLASPRSIASSTRGYATPVRAYGWSGSMKSCRSPSSTPRWTAPECAAPCCFHRSSTRSASVLRTASSLSFRTNVNRAAAGSMRRAASAKAKPRRSDSATPRIEYR